MRDCGAMAHTESRMKQPTPVGTRLREAREAAGLSQDRLAANAGIGRSTLVRIEHDHACPRLATKRVIADALGVPVFDLWPETGPGVQVEQEPPG